MPLIHESYDSLPYVDAPPAADRTAHVNTLVAADIRSAGVDTSQLHPALAPAAAAYTPNFSLAVEREHTRLQADAASKLSAVEMRRYEEVETPNDDESGPEAVPQWDSSLKDAFKNSEYVTARLDELGLLERFGKNSWLVGNSTLEDVLKGLETELADLRREREEVEALRRSQQQSVHAEMYTLDETWKEGVGRLLATQVAADNLKNEILEKRRADAA